MVNICRQVSKLLLLAPKRKMLSRVAWVEAETPGLEEASIVRNKYIGWYGEQSFLVRARMRVLPTMARLHVKQNGHNASRLGRPVGRNSLCGELVAVNISLCLILGVFGLFTVKDTA